MAEVEAADHRERAYAKLASLRDTLSKMQPHASLLLHYLDDFNMALDHLRDAGKNVEEYRIPDDWISRPKPNPDPRARLSRQSAEPKPPWIEAHYLLTRVNAVLGYFTLKAAVEAEAAETRKLSGG